MKIKELSEKALIDIFNEIKEKSVDKPLSIKPKYFIFDINERTKK